MFVGDDLAMDFLNSLAAPSGELFDWLADGEDLIAWLRRAGAVPADAAARLRAAAGPGELDAVAAQARDLREWFRAFVARRAGAPLGLEALDQLAPLNAWLAADGAFRQVAVREPDASGETAPGALGWRTERAWTTPASLLAPIHEAMGDLVCEHDFSLVRHCEGPTCTLWFLDVSKGHARRWCSMAICGNRAKAAAHRARRRSAEVG
jgi:predicted RNA-binding Zn ribbon-like protein